MIDEGDTPKLIISRLEVIKMMNGISSMKPPLSYFNCLMLIIRLLSRAEYDYMVHMFMLGGFAYTIFMMLILTLLHVYYIRVMIQLTKDVRKIAKDEKLKLDYSEVIYHLMVHKMKCRRERAALVRIAIDVSILIRKISAVLDTLNVSVTVLCGVCNRYGNDFDERTFVWVAFVPLCLMALLGNLKAVALLCFTANSAVLFVYAVLLHDFVYGPTIKNRRMIQRNASAALNAYAGAYRANGMSFNALYFRNEMASEYDFDKTGGSLNVGTAVLMILNSVIPGLGYLKYGEHFIGITSKTSNFYDMVNLLIALTQFLTCSLHLYLPFHIFFPILYKTFRPKNVVGMEVTVKIIWVLVCTLISFLASNVDTPRYIYVAVSPLLCYFIPALFETLCRDKLKARCIIFNWIIMITSILQFFTYICLKLGAIS